MIVFSLNADTESGIMESQRSAQLSVLALLGSPRKQGNTDIMTDAALAGAAEAGASVAKVYLDDHRIRPIGEVADNSRMRDDPHRDDDFPALLSRFLEADIVLWSTPVYWFGLSAQSKCFLDRLSSYFNHPDCVDRVRGKGHVVICAFGRPEKEHGEWVTGPMKATVERLRGVYLGDVCASSVYEKGKVKEMPAVLEACRALGRDAVQRVALADRG
jgi:putative NADPH-quinone reductase